MVTGKAKIPIQKLNSTEGKCFSSCHLGSSMVIIDTISGEKHKKSMLAEFVIKKVEHEKENSNSKPLPGKRNVKICKKVVRLTIMLI